MGNCPVIMFDPFNNPTLLNPHCSNAQFFFVISGGGRPTRQGVRQVHVLLPLQPEQRVCRGRNKEGKQNQVSH